MGCPFDLLQLGFLVRIWELFIQPQNSTLLQLNATMMTCEPNKGNLQIIEEFLTKFLSHLTCQTGSTLYSLSVSMN